MPVVLLFGLSLLAASTEALAQSGAGGDCSPHPTVVNSDCTVSFEARYVPEPGEVSLVSSGDAHDTGTTKPLPCDNCSSRIPMNCLDTLCVEVSDTGTVSASVGFEESYNAAVNVALSGEVGIQTTVEFRTGTTRSTTVTYSDCVTCGSDSIPGCSYVEYWISSLSTPKVARLPIYKEWWVKVDCPGNPGTWVRDRRCYPAAGYATISAQDGAASNCKAKELECPPGSCPPAEQEHGEELDPNGLV